MLRNLVKKAEWLVREISPRFKDIAWVASFLVATAAVATWSCSVSAVVKASQFAGQGMRFSFVLMRF